MPVRRALAAAILVAFPGACGDGPGGPSPQPALADVMEALFLGSGPLAAGDCASSGFFTSFPQGSIVTLAVAPTVGDAARQVLAAAIGDLNGVIQPRFQLTLGTTASDDPLPGPLEITSADVPQEVIAALCSPGGSGCTRVTLNGPVLERARTVQRISTGHRLKLHELGHAIGLCHINRNRVPAAVMTDPFGELVQERFSAVELEALRTVYASGLAPGAVRRDFVNAGLLR